MLFSLPVLGGAVAYAATPGGFEIDGNFVNNGATDWLDVLSGPTSDDNAPEATYFSASSKEADLPKDWTSSGSPPPKGDIGKTFLYTHVSGSHSFVDFGWVRNSGTGTDTYYVELNKLPNYNPSGLDVPQRSTGDLRFKIHESGGDALALEAVSIWTGTANAGAWAPYVPGAGFDFAVNSSTISIPGGGTAAADEFLEISLDLTGLVGLSPGCPAQFGTFNMRSTTGETANNLKEFIRGLRANAGSNCSKLTILKKFKQADGTAGALLPGATFTITPDPTPGAVGGSLDVTDNGTGDSDPTDGTVLIDPARPGVTYSITEKTAPTGYVRDTSTKTVTTPTNGTGATAVEFLDPLGSVTFGKTDETTGSALGGATFTVVKTGGSVSRTVTDNGTGDSDTAAGSIKVADLPLGSYTITETAAPTGYNVQSSTVSFTLDQANPDKSLGNVFSDPRIRSTLKVQKLSAGAGAPLDGAGFTLYRVKHGTETSDVAVGSCTTGLPATPYAGTGTCAVGNLLWDELYYWVEVTAPPGYNLPDITSSATIHVTKDNAGGTFAVTEFRDDTSAISTSATSATVGGSISDTATLGGVRQDAGGTILFVLYGPFISPVDPVASASSVCAPGNVAWSTSVSVDGPGNYSSGAHAVTAAGTYYWVASYSGDSNSVGVLDVPVSGSCGDAGETSTVGKQPTTLRTHATDATLPAASITDRATLSGGTSDIGGTITIGVYGDSACGTTALGTWTITVNGNGDYTTSPAYSPSTAGTYYWKASYSGDNNNAGSSEACGAMTASSHERSVVSKAPTTLRTHATDATLPAASITDTATLSGGTSSMGGSITIGVYSDSSCATAALSSWTITVSGNGDYTTTPAYAPSAAGTYYWKADYSGDANNTDSHEACGALTESSHERSVVSKAPTSLRTTASHAQLPLGTITDTVTISGGTSSATGTITVGVYGDSSCDSAALASWTITVAGMGSYVTSPAYMPTAATDYYWLASYGGDANNLSSDEGCGAVTEVSNEVSHVSKAQPTLTTVATPGLAVLPAAQIGGEGPTVHDVATLHGAATGGSGKVTFHLYGPTESSEADCESEPVFTSTVDVAAGGAVSEEFTPTETGYYWWTASFSGDAVNEPAVEGCGAENESLLVTQPALGLEKTADPASGSLVQPGDRIDYSVAVPNIGSADASEVTVIDTLPADVTPVDGTISNDGVYNATAGTITWIIDIDAASSTTLSYSVTVDETAEQGETLHNTVALGNLTSFTDHIVAIGDLALLKSVSPTGSAQYGDTLTYSLTTKANGTLDQHSIVISDVVPTGTTYVAGSATCVGTPCTATYDAASDTVTWAVGDMAAGATRTVSFKVTIDRPPAAADGGIPGTVIRNSGVVESVETPTTPSNRVDTPVTTVLGVKVVRKPPQLPVTGMPLTQSLVWALGMVLLGAAVIFSGRRPRGVRKH